MLRVVLRHVFVYACDFPGETFDAVVASEVIEHVERPDAFVGVLAQLAQPGGALVVSTISRTAESLLLAKVAAEYVLRMVPPGTHDWNRFITPGVRHVELHYFRVI